MVDYCRACNNNVPVEYEQLENVLLGLQVALEGSSHEAGATDFTLNPMTLRCCCVPSLLIGVLLLRPGNLYPSRHACYGLRLIQVCQEANAFKKFDQNVEGRLEPHRAPCSNQPVVYKKWDTIIAHRLLYTITSGVVSQHLLESLPYNTVNANIEHETGEWSPLRDASKGSKGLTITAPSTTDHLCFGPELFLQSK
jgi:hypothetical protein